MTATDEPATAPVPGLDATEQRRWEGAGQLRVVTPPAAVKRRQPVMAFVRAAVTLLPHRLRDAWPWPNRPSAVTETARSAVDRAAGPGNEHEAGTRS